METAIRYKRKRGDEYFSSADFSSLQPLTKRRRIEIETEITTSSPSYKIRKNVRYRQYHEKHGSS